MRKRKGKEGGGAGGEVKTKKEKRDSGGWGVVFGEQRERTLQTN